MLFLGWETAPTAQEQETTYREVLAALAGRKTIIRTLDAGADKPLAFANLAEEENPALGIRGSRLVRRDPGLLDDQLAALGRAASHADVDRDALWAWHRWSPHELRPATSPSAPMPPV